MTPGVQCRCAKCERALTVDSDAPDPVHCSACYGHARAPATRVERDQRLQEFEDPASAPVPESVAQFRRGIRYAVSRSCEVLRSKAPAGATRGALSDWLDEYWRQNGYK